MTALHRTCETQKTIAILSCNANFDLGIVISSARLLCCDLSETKTSSECDFLRKDRADFRGNSQETEVHVNGLESQEFSQS